MTERRQLRADPLGVHGAVSVSTTVPLDDPEVHARCMVRHLSQEQAVVLAAEILEAAGVEYEITVQHSGMVDGIRPHRPMSEQDAALQERMYRDMKPSPEVIAELRRLNYPEESGR